MGFDSFGMPAENAAIAEGGHPHDITERNMASITDQIKRMGFSYDWRRLVKSHDPQYYRWNQWFFLKFLENDLAYQQYAPVNWCDSCNTVLANEQVKACLLYTSDAADDSLRVDLGGRRIIKK